MIRIVMTQPLPGACTTPAPNTWPIDHAKAALTACLSSSLAADAKWVSLLPHFGAARRELVRRRTPRHLGQTSCAALPPRLAWCSGQVPPVDQSGQAVAVTKLADSAHLTVNTRCVMLLTAGTISVSEGVSGSPPSPKPTAWSVTNHPNAPICRRTNARRAPSRLNAAHHAQRTNSRRSLARARLRIPFPSAAFRSRSRACCPIRESTRPSANPPTRPRIHC